MVEFHHTFSTNAAVMSSGRFDLLAKSAEVIFVKLTNAHRLEEGTLRGVRDLNLEEWLIQKSCAAISLGLEVQILHGLCWPLIYAEYCIFSRRVIGLLRTGGVYPWCLESIKVSLWWATNLYRLVIVAYEARIR